IQEDDVYQEFPSTIKTTKKSNIGLMPPTMGYTISIFNFLQSSKLIDLSDVFDELVGLKIGYIYNFLKFIQELGFEVWGVFGARGWIHGFSFAEDIQFKAGNEHVKDDGEEDGKDIGFDQGGDCAIDFTICWDSEASILSVVSSELVLLVEIEENRLSH
ncbi:hypothetical protein Tco_0695169, partial [Tanacetum coccineum]